MIQFNIYHSLLVLTCLVLAGHFYNRMYRKDGTPNKVSNVLILLVVANLVFNPFYIRNKEDVTIFPMMIELYLDIAFIFLVSMVGIVITKLILNKYDKNN
jgi:hypothetical protein